MSEKFEPFRIRLTLETPVIVPDAGISLDLLLYNCLKMEAAELHLDGSCLDTILKRHKDGYLHASNMVFAGIHPLRGGDRIDTLVARTMPLVSRPRYERDLNENHLQPNGANGKFRKIVLAGGRYKVRLDHYEAYWSRWGVFYGVGDITTIRALLEHYVTFLGMRQSGTFSSVIVERIEEDFSIMDARGRLRRNVPINHSLEMADCKSAPLQDALFTPPFYGRMPEPCYTPKIMFEYL